jgi:hypothetical protein
MHHKDDDDDTTTTRPRRHTDSSLRRHTDTGTSISVKKSCLPHIKAQKGAHNLSEPSNAGKRQQAALAVPYMATVLQLLKSHMVLFPRPLPPPLPLPSPLPNTHTHTQLQRGAHRSVGCMHACTAWGLGHEEVGALREPFHHSCAHPGQELHCCSVHMGYHTL